MVLLPQLNALLADHHLRFPLPTPQPPVSVAITIANVTNGSLVVGATPSFTLIYHTAVDHSHPCSTKVQGLGYHTANVRTRTCWAETDDHLEMTPSQINCSLTQAVVGMSSAWSTMNGFKTNLGRQPRIRKDINMSGG